MSITLKIARNVELSIFRGKLKSKNTLASVSEDKSLRLWDIKTRILKSKLDGHSSGVRSVCFSPNGYTLASGSEDKSIQLWDVKILVSDSYDNSIRLWDVKTGQSLQPANTNYKDILAQFTTSLFDNNVLLEAKPYTILQISQEPQFQAQNALILKGEFVHQHGGDLRSFYKLKGSIFLETYIQEYINKRRILLKSILQNKQLNYIIKQQLQLLTLLTLFCSVQMTYTIINITAVNTIYIAINSLCLTLQPQMLNSFLIVLFQSHRQVFQSHQVFLSLTMLKQHHYLKTNFYEIFIFLLNLYYPVFSI